MKEAAKLALCGLPDLFPDQMVYNSSLVLRLLCLHQGNQRSAPEWRLERGAGRVDNFWR